MTDERPLVEGIEAYHESLREGARRERERILKLINEKSINRFKNELERLPNFDAMGERHHYRCGYWDAMKELKEELKK